MDGETIPEQAPLEAHRAHKEDRGGTWALASIDISKLSSQTKLSEHHHTGTGAGDRGRSCRPRRRNALELSRPRGASATWNGMRSNPDFPPTS